MRTRHALAIVVALAIPAVAFVPAVLAENPKPKAASDGGAKRDPENVTGISEFMEICVQGNAKILSRDFPGAIETYRKAIQLSPKQPLGHYLLGEAQLASNNLPEAEASWKQAESFAEGKDLVMKARIYFVLADVKERQKKWEEARAAWQTYLDYANKVIDAGAGVFPSSGQSRIQALDSAIKQDKEYEAVRKRIKETADGGVFTSMDGAAPADAKTGG
jgi:tetratricopeptide (TPR) repeat protein